MPHVTGYEDVPERSQTLIACCRDSRSKLVEAEVGVDKHTQ